MRGSLDFAEILLLLAFLTMLTTLVSCNVILSIGVFDHFKPKSDLIDFTLSNAR